MRPGSRLFATLLATACLMAGWGASAHAAAPAWQPMAATGPTVLPPVQSEVQTLFVDASGGSFKLTRYVTAGTGTLTAGLTFIQNVKATAGEFTTGQPIIGPGLPPGTVITGGFGDALFISQAATFSGSTSLISGPADTTEDIAWNEPAAGLEAKINALANVGGAGGSVSVSGGPGGPGAVSPYTIVYGGSLSDTNVLQLVSDGTALTGGDTHSATASTTVPGGPGTSTLALYAQNIGSFEATGVVTYEVTLPSGVTTTGTPTATADSTPGGLNDNNTWECTPGGDQTEFSCTLTKVGGGSPTVPPSYIAPAINAEITAAPGAASGTIETELSGGGAPAVTGQLPLAISSVKATQGIQAFNAGAYDSNGIQDVRAGAHPHSASTAIFPNTVRSPRGNVIPVGDFKDIVVDLPPGFLGNPVAVPQCPEKIREIDCPLNTVVGVTQPIISRFGNNSDPQPVYNTEAPYGYPGKFRFNILGANPLNATGSLRSDEDYGITVGSYNTPQIAQVFGVFFTFWGAPADPSHDSTRCTGRNANEVRPIVCEDSSETPTAFLTSSTNCEEQAASFPIAFLSTNTWQRPGEVVTKGVEISPVAGCEKLKFESGFEFLPSNAKADSPASFRTTVSMPDDGLRNPSARITPELKKSVIKLAEGVTLNPSGADGLGACSEDQIGLLGTNFARPNPIRFNKEPNHCPDSSKIGSGVLRTALLSDPLQGDLYLAEQGQGNPFGSLFAIYLVIEDPRHGIFIKLAGKVEPDSSTGQITVTLDDLPQLPFTSLDLTLKGGDRSALASPEVCGTYSSKMVGTPWSAPESGSPLQTPSDFKITEGPDGLPCVEDPADRPFDIDLNAGVDVVQAGAHSSLSFQIRRPDGRQELDTLRFDLPSGLAASLRGIPYCPDANIAAAMSRDSGRDEQSSPSCPSASRVGRTLAGAGSGPRPFYAPGELYLAGPYKGAPLSVVAITPAVAGPFDLGNVVIRNAISIDPVTAQVSTVSDPLPQVVEGVPLRVRDIRVILDRPGFGLNPTDCSEKKIDAHVTGASGTATDLSNRFQVGNCGALGFEPRTRLQLFGGIKRGKYQGVRAVVRPRPGDANISRTVVRFPKSAFVAQEHIRTVCTRVQFAADSCPKASIYGRAIAYSPLLDEPLVGNVYLRSSDNDLPDAVADLRGPANQPVKVEVAIRNDSVGGALRNTVQAVPDAPVSYFRLQMFGGKKGLIINSRNICRGKNRATVAMAAHNGRRSRERVNVFNRKCKAFKRKLRKAKRGAHRSKPQARRARQKR